MQTAAAQIGSEKKITLGLIVLIVDVVVGAGRGVNFSRKWVPF